MYLECCGVYKEALRSLQGLILRICYLLLFFLKKAQYLAKNPLIFIIITNFTIILKASSVHFIEQSA